MLTGSDEGVPTVLSPGSLRLVNATAVGVDFFVNLELGTALRNSVELERDVAEML